MLINKITRQAFQPKQGKESSDAFLAKFDEYKAPLPHANHPYFKLEERVRIRQLTQLSINSLLRRRLRWQVKHDHKST